MVKSKTDFQHFASRYNVCIHSRCTNNGACASAPFKKSCDQHQQEITYCAVGGHWQNDLAEWFIGVITQTAKTLILLAIFCWPGVVTEEFWPFAFRHECTFHNVSIHSDLNKTPHHLFTGIPAQWKLDDFRVFGCPVFILDKHLQDSDTLPKWRSRSWLGMYVGQSLQHAGNVPVIYNPATTQISPPFHVVFDDQCIPVIGNQPSLPDSFYQSVYTQSNWLCNNAFAM